MLQLLGLGVLATVAYQALINLMVVTGLAPTKGIALPLLSSGGTGWILTAGSLGLLIAMDRAHARDEIAEQDAGVRPAGGAAALPEIVVREEAQRLLEAASAASAPVLASAVSARSADLPT
jgi:cell division protein FtsW